MMAVRRRLLGDDVRGASVVVCPAFDRQWALRVVADREGGRITYVVAGARLSEDTGPDAPVSRVAVSVHAATFAAVDRAWSMMLSRASRPTELRRVIDGTHYLFIRSGGTQDTRAGWTWSPPAATAAGELAGLVDTLRGYVLAPVGDRPRLEATILHAGVQVAEMAERLQ